MERSYDGTDGSPGPNTSGGAAPVSAVPPAPQALDRQALSSELLDVMTSWSPRDRGSALKSWHRHALSLVHLNVLSALEVEGPLSMKRLAETMDVADASVTGIIERMEKRGLVERRHDTDDRRVVNVHLTDGGLAVFSRMAEQRRAMVSRVIAQLTADEMSSLLVGLRAVHAARKRVMEQAPPAEPDESTESTESALANR